MVRHLPTPPLRLLVSLRAEAGEGKGSWFSTCLQNKKRQLAQPQAGELAGMLGVRPGQRTQVGHRCSLARRTLWKVKEFTQSTLCREVLVPVVRGSKVGAEVQGRGWPWEGRL